MIDPSAEKVWEKLPDHEQKIVGQVVGYFGCFGFVAGVGFSACVAAFIVAVLT